MAVYSYETEESLSGLVPTTVIEREYPMSGKRPNRIKVDGVTFYRSIRADGFGKGNCRASNWPQLSWANGVVARPGESIRDAVIRRHKEDAAMGAPRIDYKEIRLAPGKYCALAAYESQKIKTDWLVAKERADTDCGYGGTRAAPR